MPDLSQFPITKRWPAKHPIGCSSIPSRRRTASRSPSCWKRSASLTRRMPSTSPRMRAGCRNSSSLNPNGKIPAIVDPNGPGGLPLGLFESGAILQYLAEKTEKLLSADPIERMATIQWVYFQMAAVGPIFGQVGFFHKFAGKEIEDKRPLERYVAESKRLLGVLEDRLKIAPG